MYRIIKISDCRFYALYKYALYMQVYMYDNDDDDDDDNGDYNSWGYKVL